MLAAQHLNGHLELVELNPANYWPKNGGYVSYDPVKKQFRIATSEYVATPDFISKFTIHEL